MLSAGRPCRSDPRFVGDPIDVVTGANTGVTADLVQRGPVPFRWVRYYSSARCQTLGSLGRSQSHDFDRLLYRDLDGLRYEDPFGDVTGFEDLAVGGRHAANGMLLTRTEENFYVIAQPGEPDQEFRFSGGGDVARLACLRCGEHAIAFRYTGNGILNEIVDSRGRLIRVITDEAGRVFKLELAGPAPNRPAQALLTYEYDASGNLIRATDLYKTTLTFAYDAGHRMTRHADRRGYSFHFEYDDLGRCIHSRGDDGFLEVFLTYEPEARTTFVRRGDGGQWIYFYNETGAITQVTDPYGNATLYVQDDLGRTVQEIDPNGNVTQFHYNALGKHDYRIDPLGYILPTNEEDPDAPDPRAYHLPETPLEWEYGHLLDPERVERPRRDEPLLQNVPAAVANTFLDYTGAYDSAAKGGAVAQAAEAPAAVVVDEQDRPVQQSGAAAGERWKYDANGGLEEYHDRDGRVYRFRYGSWNLLHEEVDPLGHATSYQYSAEEFVTKITDPGGTASEFRYDLKNRPVEFLYQGRVQETYRYDRAENIIEKRDAQGRTLVTWEIGPGNLDAVRRLAGGETHTFQHDERGRVTEAATPAGVLTFAYAEGDRPVADRRDGRGVAHELDLGQLVATTYFDKFRVTYETDDAGELAITDPTGAVHRVKVAGGLIARLLANGTQELCRYEADGFCRRKAVIAASFGTAPWLRSYAYSAEGDLQAVADTRHGQTRYQYDAAHRLAEDSPTDGSRRAFGYDPAGNLVRQPGLTGVELERGNRLRTANGDRFTYNDRDHISAREGSRGTTQYEYNALDLLTRCEINGEAWTAAYDALCRRTLKTWRGQTTTYYWDDFRLAAEVRYGGGVRLYLYVDEVALVPFMFVEYASLKAAPETGQRYYVFTNHLGVPVRVEDDAGTAVWGARVDPYGLAHVTPNSTVDMPLRFPGHLHDPETGLHYNRFRYYSPELGRYLQIDPLGPEGGVNLYAYAGNPLTAVDIDGLKCSPGKGKGKGGKGRKGAKGKGSKAPKSKPGKYPRRGKDGKLRNKDGSFAKEPRGKGARKDRKSEYPSGYRAGVKDGVLEDNRIKSGPNKGAVRGKDGKPILDSKGKPVPDDKITLDHDPPVVQRWNGKGPNDPDAGRNQSRADRNDDYNDKSKLYPMAKSDNSSEGGKLKDRYQQQTGPNYSS